MGRGGYSVYCSSGAQHHYYCWNKSTMKLYLKNWLSSAAVAAVAVICTVPTAYASEQEVISPTPPTTNAPFVGAKMFINGKEEVVLSDQHLADVYGCCESTSLSADECPDGKWWVCFITYVYHTCIRYFDLTKCCCCWQSSIRNCI